MGISGSMAPDSAGRLRDRVGLATLPRGQKDKLRVLGLVS
jgi:hypothetical protein